MKHSRVSMMFFAGLMVVGMFMAELTIFKGAAHAGQTINISQVFFVYPQNIGVIGGSTNVFGKTTPCGTSAIKLTVKDDEGNQMYNYCVFVDFAGAWDTEFIEPTGVECDIIKAKAWNANNSTWVLKDSHTC